MSKRKLVSCHQCACLPNCFRYPGQLAREAARQAASSCTSWRKGLTTEVVTVMGSGRGMSRKGAERLCAADHARFIGPGLLLVTACQQVVGEGNGPAPLAFPPLALRLQDEPERAEAAAASSLSVRASLG